MQTPRVFSATVALAITAGCMTGSFVPTVVSASTTGVTYRIPVDRLEETREAAENYCNERGRVAYLESVAPAGDNRSLARFECR